MSIGEGWGGRTEQDGEERYMKAKLALHRLNSPERDSTWCVVVEVIANRVRTTFSSSFFFLLLSFSSFLPSFLPLLSPVTREKVYSIVFKSRVSLVENRCSICTGFPILNKLDKTAGPI